MLAAPGYPDAPRPGGTIAGLERWPAPADEDARRTWCFHAGTRADGDRLLAAGGRVLTVVAQRPTLAEACAAAYASLQGITLEGGQFRRDVGT